jgi:sortase (surface protein transpeptidase)
MYQDIHYLQPSIPEPQPRDLELQNKASKRYLKLAKITGVIGLALFLISYAPSAWYALKTAGGQVISRYLVETAEKADANLVEAKDDYQPPQDTQLSFINSVKISAIKLDTEINEATYESYEDALKKGVWRVSGWGTPEHRSKPTILVAHRFGYLKWSNAFRKKNSFYNLPKLKEGDTVEVVWKQRKYIYAIYGESEGTEITDYSADLILYTCKDLNSDIRIFRYAKLLRI